MKAGLFPLLAGGLVVLALAAHANPANVPPRPRIPLMDLASKVIDYVSRGESGGNYGAQNRNADGAGLSFGILQWTQRSGSLGRLLRAMRAVDAPTFDRIFSPDAGTLLTVSTSNTEAVRMSLPLWQAPWTTRFTEAGNYLPFQQVQVEAAKTGASWKAALEIAGIFQVQTERALILFFDRANHHGPYGAPKIARSLKADLLAQGRNPVPYPELLRAYAARCAAGYRRNSAPPSLVTSSGAVWKPVGNEWHLYAGKVDLYAVIVRRTSQILNDPMLSDVAMGVV